MPIIKSIYKSIILSIGISVQMSGVRPEARRALGRCMQLTWRKDSGTVLYIWRGGATKQRSHTTEAGGEEPVNLG